MPLTPGDNFDRYRLEALIGEGGMGRVYRAFDPKLRRRVAIKILQTTHFSDGSDGVARVMREAQAAAALDHPGVVAVFDVSEAEGQPFIVMEFVDGRSLRSCVGAAEIPMLERLRWMTDVARILAAAHRAGLVHRDIKPENVMIRNDGAIKLLDFGIARRLENSPAPSPTTHSGSPADPAESSMIGTPYYMAPEQVQRRPIDARADQFGWGVMAYELFTGALPWKTVKEGFPSSVAVVTEQQAPLRTEEVGLPAHVGRVLQRALEKSPSQRFESMDTLVAALNPDASWSSSLVFPATPKETIKTVANTQQGTHTEIEPRPIHEPPQGLTTKMTRSPVLRVLVLAAVLSTGAMQVVRNRPQTNPPLLTAHLASMASNALEPPVEPLPPNALAAAAYANGVRHFEQAALAAGIERFKTAIEYEPKFAAAYLRLAIGRLIDGPHPAGSESFLEARRLRRFLDSQDRLLLDAFAPSFDQDPPGLDETARRLSDIEQRFPKDPEIALFRPMVLTVAGRDEDGSAAFRAYIEQYPAMATPWLALAYIHGRRDELDLAHQAIEKCLAIEADAFDCIWFGAKLDAYAGRCKDMENRVRRWQELKPDSLNAISMRIQAMIAQNIDASTIDVTMTRAFRDLSIGNATRIQQRFVATRSILEGKFDEADRILTALPHDTQLENADYLWLKELQAALHEEMDDQPRAVAMAADMLLRKKSLPGTGDLHVEGIADDPSMAFQGILLTAGSIDRAEFEQRRAAWMTMWRSRGATRSDRDLWTRAYSTPTRTAEAAREALAVIEPLGPPLRFFVDHLLVVDTARVYQLAGRNQEAAKLLGEACMSCLGPLEPIRFVQAHALLGRAHEALDNREAACKAYAIVLRHWGAARPASVTAKQTRERWTELDCKRFR